MRTLLERGADVLAMTNDGKKALDIVRRRVGHSPIAVGTNTEHQPRCVRRKITGH
jgi:hypothetical protein